LERGGIPKSGFAALTGQPQHCLIVEEFKEARQISEADGCCQGDLGIVDRGKIKP
jgi:hypothetical protein